MKKLRKTKKRAYSVDEEHKLLYIQRPREEIQSLMSQFKDEIVSVFGDHIEEKIEHKIEEKIDKEKTAGNFQALIGENEALQKSRDFWRGIAIDLLVFILGGIVTVVLAILLRK